jgi:Family of unknown function (DUF5678)
MAIMKSIDYLDKDYEYFIKANLEKYQGKYIAIHEGRIQICGTSLREVYEFMKKKYPDIIPFITQVQSGQAMVL